MKYVKSFIMSFKEPSWKDWVVASLLGIIISSWVNPVIGQ